MPSRPQWRHAAFGAAIAAACLNSNAQGKAYSDPDPASSQTAAAAQSASPVTSAQIEELLKQTNEQMNVQGQFHRAQQLAEQALELSQDAGDKVRTSRAMVFLSAAYGYEGRLVEALDVSQKNLNLAREIGNDRILEDALNTVGGVLGELGRYEASLEYLYECLGVARRSGDANMQYMSLLNIGEAYVRSGDPDKAEIPLQESLRLARGLTYSPTTSNPSKKGTEMALLNLADMEAERQHYETALKYYERVHASRPESPLWVIAALAGMADAHERLGEPQKAIELLREAIALSEKAATGLQYARLLSHLGVNQEALGQLEQSLASQGRALELVRQAGGNPDYEWQIQSRLGHVQRAMGRNVSALESYRRSIDGIEHLRGVAVNSEEERAGVMAKSRQVYAEMADLLYELHQNDEALQFAERGRARAFLDTLGESRVGIADGLTTEQHRREDEILARISAAQKKEWERDTSAQQKKKHEAALTAAEQDLEQLHVEVRQSNPRNASVRYPEPVSLEQIQRGLLDEHTALVEYLVGDKRSLVWVVTKNTVDTFVLPPRREIEEQVAAYRKVLTAPASSLTLNRSLADVDRVGANAYRSIFRPIEHAVGPARKLIIVPDGALDYLPFEALVRRTARTPTGNLRPSFLIEKVAVVYGPSASALLAVAAMNRAAIVPPKLLLAFGDPSTTTRTPSDAGYADRGFSFARLPYARDEVLAIGRLFPVGQRHLYLGADAREETVKSEELDDYRFIHFATHGFLDEARPARSGIVLSHAAQSREDGVLQIDEIMRLKLDADLVTLSACSTGLGRLVNGEGILGLTRAMFYAGARNVAVSLWNVNDSATAALMESLYRNLRAGVAEDEAMRRAKLSLLHGRRQPTWQHPYFWASFVVEGKGD